MVELLSVGQVASAGLHESFVVEEELEDDLDEPPDDSPDEPPEDWP